MQANDVADALKSWLAMKSGGSHRDNHHFQWVIAPQKNVPPHNTPDRFAAVSPDKILRLYCVGGLFLFREAVPWKFHEPSECDTDFPANAAAKQGQELRSGQTAINIHEQRNSLLIFVS